MEIARPEWGFGLDFMLDTIIRDQNNIIFTELEVKADSSIANVTLVTDIQRDKEPVYWSALNLHDFNDDCSELSTIHLMTFLQDIKYLPTDLQKNYLWNKDKRILEIYSLKVTVLNGQKNPYGIFYNLKK